LGALGDKCCLERFLTEKGNSKKGNVCLGEAPHERRVKGGLFQWRVRIKKNALEWLASGNVEKKTTYNR